MKKFPLIAILCATTLVSGTLFSEPPPALATSVELIPQPVPTKEPIPSEDAIIANLHCFGLINGRANIFRSASPIRDLTKPPKDSPQSKLTPDEALAQATARMIHLRELGIRTIFNLQDPTGEEQPDIAMESRAAKAAGIVFVNDALSGSGKNSFEDMSTGEVLKQLMPICEDITNRAKSGQGVLIHCHGGRDRTGIVAALLRMKWQGWTAEQAIFEMRLYGHKLHQFSKNPNDKYSWIEQHVLNAENTTPNLVGSCSGACEPQK